LAGLAAGHFFVAADISAAVDMSAVDIVAVAAVDMSAVDFVAVAGDTPVVAEVATGRAEFNARTSAAHFSTVRRNC
jgi:hypothetical protein